MSDRLINNTPFMPDVPFHPDLLLQNSIQQPIKQNIQEINPKLILILKKIFQNPKELGDLINKENLVHKFLPKTNRY